MRKGFILCFAAQFLRRLHGHIWPLLLVVIRLVAQGDALFLELLQPLPVDLNTSGATMQQEASRKLNMTPRRTMAIAQQLYEGVDLSLIHI